MSAPKEIKLRRYKRNDRMIPGFDFVAGQRFLSADGKSEFVLVGEAKLDEPRVYLAFDAEGNVKQFDWYGRDGDLDGDVQDGTPWQRRSRSIAHLRIGKNPKKRPLRFRIRDLPFPFPAEGTVPKKSPTDPIPDEVSEKKDIFSASPTTSSVDVSAGSFGGVIRGGDIREATHAVDMVRTSRSHNSRMRKARKPKWSRTTLSVLQRVAERAESADPENADAMRRKRVDSFLKVLEHGRPESPLYVGDNDLLPKDHPWRSEGMKSLIRFFDKPEVGLRFKDFRSEIHETLVKAAPKPGLGTFGGGTSIGGGKKLSVDGPGIRNAISKGAIVDDMGRIRCPIGSPGAMQFTNWQLEGCGKPSAARMRNNIYEAVSEADLASFLANGGQRISSVDLAKAVAERNKEAIVSASRQNVKRRERVVRAITENTEVVGDAKRVSTTPEGRGRVTKVKSESRLSSILRLGRDGRSKRVTVDMETGDQVASGIAVPRSERGLVLDAGEMFDELGVVNEDALAQVVGWLDQAVDLEPDNGAQSVAVTLTRVDAPRRPMRPNTPPIKGRAQELATQANGDPQEFMRLLDAEGYVVFDFETTGFGQYGNMPVSATAIRYKDGKEVERRTIFMNPERSLSPWSRANLTNADGDPLTQEWLAGQPSIAEGMQGLSEFIGDSILVAHNLDFDIKLLEEHSAKAGVEQKYSGTVDTLKLARQIIPKSVQPKHDLDSLKTRFKIKSGKWHTSDGDAVAADGILRGITKYGKDNGMESWIFDADAQQRFYDDEMQKYEAESAVAKKAIAAHKEKWGTEGKVLRIDVADIFPDGGDNPRAQKKAAKKAAEVASARGESAFVRLGDGSVMELGGEISTESVTVEPPNPATARMFNTSSALKTALAKLKGEDNMNIDRFSEKDMKSMMEEMRKVPGFEWIDPENPDHLYLAVAQGADRLTQLLEMASPDERNRWRMWYDGAGQFASDMAKKYGISRESAVAVIAALSPTTDWNANIALAEHAIKLSLDKNFTLDKELSDMLIAKLVKSRQDREYSLKKNIAQKTEEIKVAREALEGLKQKPGTREEEKKIRKAISNAEEYIAAATEDLQNPPRYSVNDFIGKRLSDFDEDTAGRIFQIHARTRGRSYIGQTYPGDPNDDKAQTDGILTYSMDVTSPSSYTLQTELNLARVQSGSNYKKVLRILAADKDGKPDLKVIDRNIGLGSKVRSFYNNILNPKDAEYADLTSDTHNFGAVTAVPVSSAHDVLDVMFNNMQSRGSGKTYPLFRAMSVLAASRWNRDHPGDDLLPREVQSITWEKIRALVPTVFPDPNDINLTPKKDTTLKSHMTDAMAVITRIIGGPEGVPPSVPLTAKLSAFRRKYRGREMELLSDLSSYLQSVPRNKRAEALKQWMKNYGLPEITDSDRLPKAKKIVKGVAYDKDVETGAALDEFGNPIYSDDVVENG